MNGKIIVQNNVRISNLLNIELEHDEDLLLNDNIKVIKFINNYSKYLYSCEENDMIEIFKLTGLLICHEYIEKETLKKIYFSLNGPYSYDYVNLKSRPSAYNNHLIIETYVDHLNVFSNNIMADNNIIYQFKNTKNNENIYIVNDMNITEQIKYLKENNYLLPNINNIKKILIDPFYNIISLTNDGKLYINDYLYSKGVECIFELNTTDIKFIYKNGLVEEYSNHYNGLISQKYDKILYDENFLATLKNGELILYLILELDCSKSILMRFMEVDDIKCTKKGSSLWDRYLIIKKNNEKIKLSLGSIIFIS